MIATSFQLSEEQKAKLRPTLQKAGVDFNKPIVIEEGDSLWTDIKDFLDEYDCEITYTTGALTIAFTIIFPPVGVAALAIEGGMLIYETPELARCLAEDLTRLKR
ncbi:MAG: Unknown protein [uncultured Campylobacterales bacterium]|uniref:Uncharacterized protein n=1 Tax=uncultured Campylobacterales bacterium TaxID=352960 RepID=A0A6S6SRY3_9BACT|nr:MAG: Unknown protein [uncultured Campylobacterales bacterium]